MWEYGGYASEGVKQIAELGSPVKMEEEIRQKVRVKSYCIPKLFINSVIECLSRVSHYVKSDILLLCIEFFSVHGIANSSSVNVFVLCSIYGKFYEILMFTSVFEILCGLFF